jgi:very-short-patch-repair endonuclease
MRFRRQHPLGPYIVDFICLENRIVVEIDGGQHFASAQDETRDRWLNARGYQVLRFWNNEVLLQIEQVLARIAEAKRGWEPLPSP